MNSFIEVLIKIKFNVINIFFFNKKNNIIFIKNSNYKNIKIVFSPQFIDAERNEDIMLLNDNIKKFLLTMNDKCKNFNPRIFIKNFKKTIFDISKINKKNRSKILGVVEISKTNIFTLYSMGVIFHELLHLSSIKKDYHGAIYHFIDEGYTQILAERYFNECKQYPIEVDILKKIESILGIDFMEENYFNGKPNNIINELTKYESKENIANFIMYVDELYTLIYYPVIKKDEKEIQNNIDKIIEILFYCLQNKIKDLKSYDELMKTMKQGNWFKYINNINQNEFYVNKK